MRATGLCLAGSLTVILGTASISSADVMKMNPHSAEHFPIADANSDGNLSRSEFEAFVELEAEDKVGQSRRIKRFNAYDRAYSALDANADGALTLEEIAAFQTSQ